MTLEQRFVRFFGAVNEGASPYPWQRALVERIAGSGRWPAAIAAPTGSGKSSVIDVHVFLVAEHAAGRIPVRPPRRLVLVAPRRVLVDDQFERAAGMARMLRERVGPDQALLDEVTAALSSLLTSPKLQEAPLLASRLRGGALVDLAWRLDPAQCQIICATPQMWGSRLLLRGYRASARSRNLETGLLAHDVAVVIDEAHLHERLVETAERVAAMTPSPGALQVVAMSATRANPAAHRLTDEDLRDDQLVKRVRAAKSIEIVEVDEWPEDRAAALVARARAAYGSGTVGVFVNTVATALEVASALRTDASPNVVLVCGRMRPADLRRLREKHPGVLDSRGNDAVDFLVSTQSLEVGVDLDLPAIVTEIAPAAALAQRAGRLNRSGHHPGASLCVVLPRELDDTTAESLAKSMLPYQPEEIVAAARWLVDLRGDASPERIAASELPLSSRPVLPRLTRVDVETLAMTSEPLAAEPDVSLYVDEPRDRREMNVSIAARDHLDLPEDVVRAMLLAAPPRAHELAAMSVGKDLAAVIDAAEHAWALRWHDGELTADPLDAPRVGDVVVLAAGSRVCTQGVIGLPRGRRGAAAEPLDDVTSAPPDDGGADTILRLDAGDVATILEDDPVLGGRAARRALADVVDRPDLAARLRGHRRLTDLDVRWCDGDGDADVGLLVVREAARAGALPRAQVADALVTIEDHQLSVAERMDSILRALGALDLGAGRAPLIDAARWHDEGKRHPRFQRRMGASPDSEPVAKPMPGHVADRGDGWRHEQLSAAIAAARCDGDPLVTVLICAHHGTGLPAFDRDDDGLLDGWDGCTDAAEAHLRRLFGPAGQYERERRQLQRSLGVHSLAHLEALLRCADIQISKEGG